MARAVHTMPSAAMQPIVAAGGVTRLQAIISGGTSVTATLMRK